VSPPRLLLLDVVVLDTAGLSPDPEAADEGSSLLLMPDPADPERLFCCQPRAAHLLTLSWLPALANHLAEGADTLLSPSPGKSSGRRVLTHFYLPALANHVAEGPDTHVGPAHWQIIWQKVLRLSPCL
jgi:hypothetical protein